MADDRIITLWDSEHTTMKGIPMKKEGERWW
jgi:hypothetical protein